MAITLELAYLEANDAATLQLSDVTGETALTDWTVGGNISYDDIDGVVGAGTYNLTLDIDITTSDGTTTSYDTIDMYDIFLSALGPAYTYPDDFVFELNSTHLLETGVAIGTATDELPDGIYEFTYTILDQATGLPDDTIAPVLVESVLIDGQVRIKVYDALREIGVKYDCVGMEIPVDCTIWADMMDAIFKYTLFYNMISNVSEATESDVLTMLTTLENLTVND